MPHSAAALLRAAVRQGPALSVSGALERIFCQQYRALKEQSPDGALEEYRKRVEKLACGFPLSDNPFAWQAFGRRYGRQGTGEVPDYLRAANFERLRRAAQRATVTHDSLQGHLARQGARSLDRSCLYGGFHLYRLAE